VQSPSFDWKRLHSNPAATGQRWYCQACQGKRYKTAMGLVVEMRVRQQDGSHLLFYFWAPLPPDHMKDAQLMKIQERFAKQNMSADELLSRLPRVEPSGDIIEENPDVPKHFRFTKGMTIAQLDTLHWDQIFKVMAEAMDEPPAFLKKPPPPPGPPPACQQRPPSPPGPPPQ